MANEETSCIKVSVIMGVYNIENLANFDLTIESILKQSHQNLEFIICDDGSTDNTYKIISDYAELDNRIVLIKNSENKGLAYTLNHCAAVATSNFLARQDADDRSEPTRLERQLEFLMRHPFVDFVGSNVILYDEEKAWAERILPEIPCKNDFLWVVPFVHGSVMMKKENLLQAGGYRVEQVTRRAEDYDLFMRMYSMGMQGANIQDNLYFYREDKENLNKRKYCYRLDEVKIRYRGFRLLGLFPAGYIYCLKPLIVGLIPPRLLQQLKFTSKHLMKVGK